MCNRAPKMNAGFDSLPKPMNMLGQQSEMRRIIEDMMTNKYNEISPEQRRQNIKHQLDKEMEQVRQNYLREIEPLNS
jgi:hypothetical protein